MTKRQAVEALDNSLRDIMDRPQLPFGGKTFVFGGDFRQVLPVVRKGVKGSNCRCFATEIVPMGLHETS